MPVCVIDDCKEHVEQDEEAAEDVENEEPGTLAVPIKFKSRLLSYTDNPTPRNALFVRWSVRWSRFLPPSNAHAHQSNV